MKYINVFKVFPDSSNNWYTHEMQMCKLHKINDPTHIILQNLKYK